MSNNETVSVVLVGVGGQGILLASEIVAQAAMIEGYDVKTNEVHGMAQRGGSVLAQIRYGKKVNSPLVAKGTAKVLGALERIEAMRYADYLAEDGAVVVNSQAIVPITVSMGVCEYPDAAKEKLESMFDNLTYFDAAEVAKGLGNVKAANVVTLGAVSKGLDISEQAWKSAIEKSVPERFRELNLKAFEAGRNI